MEYTIKDICRISGQTARTIRFYDKIGLLKPHEIRPNGYRVYTERQLGLLQQILFYRELGFKLSDIKEIISSPSFDMSEALSTHIVSLKKERDRISAMIDCAEKTLKNLKGEIDMRNEEKFHAFKQRLVDENEAKYGDEIRQKYGSDAIDKSNEILLSMDEKQYNDIEELTKTLNDLLKEAFYEGDPASDKAQKVCRLHEKWLTFYWGFYDKNAHMSVAEMYVKDERFTEYYNKIAPGCAVFLRDAVKIYAKSDK